MPPQFSFSSFLSPCVACCTHESQKLGQLERGPHGGHKRPLGTRRTAASTVSVEHRVGGDLKERRGASQGLPGSMCPSGHEIRDLHSVSQGLVTDSSCLLQGLGGHRRALWRGEEKKGKGNKGDESMDGKSGRRAGSVRWKAKGAWETGNRTNS